MTFIDVAIIIHQPEMSSTLLGERCNGRFQEKIYGADDRGHVTVVTRIQNLDVLLYSTRLQNNHTRRVSCN